MKKQEIKTDKTWAVALGVVVALVLTWGYTSLISGYLQEPKDSGPVETDKVTIKDYEFQPSAVRIKEGTTVTWVNRDLSLHNIKFKFFKSKNIDTNQKYQYKFTKKGIYKYKCGIHTFMIGEIVVE